MRAPSSADDSRLPSATRPPFRAPSSFAEAAGSGAAAAALEATSTSEHSGDEIGRRRILEILGILSCTRNISVALFSYNKKGIEISSIYLVIITYSFDNNLA